MVETLSPPSNSWCPTHLPFSFPPAQLAAWGSLLTLKKKKSYSFLFCFFPLSSDNRFERDEQLLQHRSSLINGRYWPYRAGQPLAVLGNRVVGQCERNDNNKSSPLMFNPMIIAWGHISKKKERKKRNDYYRYTVLKWTVIICIYYTELLFCCFYIRSQSVYLYAFEKCVRMHITNSWATCNFGNTI